MFKKPLFQLQANGEGQGSNLFASSVYPYSYQHEQIDQFFALNFKNVQPSNNKQKVFSCMFLNPNNFFQFEF